MGNIHRLFYLLGLVIFSVGLQAQSNQGLPPNPEPGKCYVKCVTPDRFEERTEQILVKPGYTVLETVPAVYETRTERVLVKEASKRFVFHPAEYSTERVPYVSKDARTDLRIIPASFSTGEETLEVYPKIGRWEYTTLPDCPSANPNDCQVLCWNEYPARYETVRTTPLAADASTANVPVNELTASYEKQVISREAYVEEIAIPAEYATISKEVLVTPASSRSVEVPPVYTTVTKTVLVEKGGVTVWEEIDCKLTEANILPIYYDFNSATLTAESRRTIDRMLLSLLNDKPNISVELASHTDARGNDDYNMALSQRRAQSVVNYLISKGINSSRLVARGYGETRLKNNCSNGVNCSDDMHRQNRRTEFRVIGG